jgi:sulfopropanediol 3-dehydrogenase
MREELKAAAAPERASGANHALVETVAKIIDDVRVNGDEAVRRHSGQFDQWVPPSFRLTEGAVADIVKSVPETVMDDLRFAQQQIASFAHAQRATMQDLEVETLPGVFLGHRHVPVAAAGAYVPGGRYPLTASAHMTVLTAKVAGVPRVAATTPPAGGAPPTMSITAMHLAGADEIYVLGGVQAVAALALGTETIDPVNMLTGPGNAYVAEAKRQLFGEVGIDLFAGPTETLIVADDQADPFTIAVDLLSQAEHGPDSPCVLITTSRDVGVKTLSYIEDLLPGLPTREIAGPAWHDHGQVHVVDDLDQAYTLADFYASEHVQIMTAEPRDALEKMHDYGALFLGANTCVPYGDKVIGTNHTLPTEHAARYTGGLWVGKFLKTVTFQEVRDTKTGAHVGEICARMSRLEKFEGHARSGDLRAAQFNGTLPDWAPPSAHEAQQARRRV